MNPVIFHNFCWTLRNMFSTENGGDGNRRNIFFCTGGGQIISNFCGASTFKLQTFFLFFLMMQFRSEVRGSSSRLLLVFFQCVRFLYRSWWVLFCEATQSSGLLFSGDLKVFLYRSTRLVHRYTVKKHSLAICKCYEGLMDTKVVIYTCMIYNYILYIGMIYIYIFR